MVTNHAANSRTAHGSKRTPASKHGPSDGADSGTGNRILVVPGHVGATSQTGDHYCSNYAYR